MVQANSYGSRWRELNPSSHMLLGARAMISFTLCSEAKYLRPVHHMEVSVEAKCAAPYAA